jgi:hypothetical protein
VATVVIQKTTVALDVILPMVIAMSLHLARERLMILEMDAVDQITVALIAQHLNAAHNSQL